MFIRLTLANGCFIWINFNNVESFGVINERNFRYAGEMYYGLTYVCPTGLKEDERPYIVQETPKEIMEMLWKEEE